MTAAPVGLDDTYWQNLRIQTEDLDALSAHLLEVETPLSPEELAAQLVADRMRREGAAQAKALVEEGAPYRPKERYAAGRKLVFPALGGARGQVAKVRPADTLNGQSFEVIQVEMEGGEPREFAAGLDEHALNVEPEAPKEPGDGGPEAVLAAHGTALAEKISALDTVAYLEERAARSSKEGFQEVLGRVPSAPPAEGDELPPGLKAKAG